MSARFVSSALLLFVAGSLVGCPRTADPDAGPLPSDAPRLDGPGADVPGLDAPGADVPGLDAPGADVPGLDAPLPDAGPVPDGGMVGPTDPPVVITTCAGDALPSLPAGAACATTAGSSSILVTADVLLPAEVLRGGQVLIDGTGHITCVACDCSAGAAGATTISCPDGAISPGLINAHEHMTFQGSPYTNTGERYEHRHDWRRGLRGHTRISAPGGASANEIRWGELRMVLGGATSINGSGSAAGLLRNLDRSGAEMEGLGEEAVDYDTFPLGDSGGTQLTSGCGYPAIRTTADIMGDDAYTPHLSEGIDAVSRNEFLCVSMMGATDLIEPQTAFIHGIGLAAIDIASTRAGGSMLIWSPRSNVTLYGDTARVPEYDALGVPAALGTDWVYSGSMNMLRELQCADGLDTDYFGDHFDDRDLWLMATRNGAMATGTDDVIGTIRTGLVADLAIFDAHVNVDYRAVIDAEPDDVVLVMRSGRPLYGAAAVVAGLAGGSACDTLDVCGTSQRVCTMAEVGMTLAALSTANSGEYPLFFCGTPTNEPSCHPERPRGVAGSTVYTGMLSSGDMDGDGIANAADACPDVFDPIRPMDGGDQPDFDMDGLGDACDPCPFDTTTACALPTPNDRDGDTVADVTDNCPDVSNTDQMDMDTDGHGDVCDLCPTTANPGTAGCPTSIYDIKDGTVPTGARVTVVGGLVTARISNGFFMQVKEGDAGYTGPDFSGIFVFTGSAPVAMVGDRVRVDGTVQDYFGQLQLSMTTVVVMSSGVAPPAAIVVTPDEVGTGGSRAGALEGVLVRVGPASVTAVDTMFFEFTLDGRVAVDDAVFRAAPFPAVGQRFLSLTGVLAFRNSNSKILLRSATDLVTSNLAFGPAASFTRVGATSAPTFPGPLTVTLRVPAVVDTFVAITSGTPSALTVVGAGVTIPTGSSSAPVLVSGVAPAASVTLTATLGAEMATALVGVLDVAAAPSTVSLSPDAVTVGVGGTQTFTVMLDIPAPPGGTVVSLAVTPTAAGTLPLTVTVPANQISATFVLDLEDSATAATVTATLGSSTDEALVTVSAGSGGLMLNEIDYDQPGTDGGEFIEIYNGAPTAADLTGVVLVRVNGSGTPAEYGTRIALSGSLAAGGYLVIATTDGSLVIDPTATVVRFAGATDNVQNGGTATMPAADGLALVHLPSMTLIDAVSYEGALPTVTLTGVGAVSLVEGTALPAARADSNTAAGSLARVPNGSDTNDAEGDWAFTSTPTPGAANVP